MNADIQCRLANVKAPPTYLPKKKLKNEWEGIQFSFVEFGYSGV